MATHFLPLSKTNLANLHPKANICAKFHENCLKTEEAVRDERFPPIFSTVCRYHDNAVSATVDNMCLAHLHTKANIRAKFYENCSKTEEEVRDTRFATD